MSLKLTPSTESLVQAQIDSGRYRDADEVVRKAVALLVDRDQEREELRRSIAEGFEQLEHGEGSVVTPELFKRLRENAMRRLAAGEMPGKDILP
jgi:antitoxin ParD1/3/4